MAYNVHNRLDLLGDRMKVVNADRLGSVTYERSGVFSLSIAAALDNSPRVVELVPGISVTRVRYKDFIFDAADLLGNTPQSTDTITKANGEVYRVIAIDESPFQYTTGSKKRIRVHAERVTSVAVATSLALVNEEEEFILLEDESAVLLAE